MNEILPIVTRCRLFVANKLCQSYDAGRLSAYFHYLGVKSPMSIPGSLVLGGWDLPEYGRLCDPSTPPTFDALPGINSEHLPGFINSLLNLRAGSSTDGRYFVNPEIMGSGQLRPLAVAMAATIVMYYEYEQS